jgi:UDP-glucose 4-epimerase
LVELLNGEVEYIPKRPGEPARTHADISKAKLLLGWEPKVSFEEGVNNVLDKISLWRDAPIWIKSDIEMATNAWFKYLGEHETN